MTFPSATKKLSFTVVGFLEEQLIEVVSSSWITENQDRCLWPDIFGKKFWQFVRSHKNLNENETRNSYVCKVIATTHNFLKARKLSNKAVTEKELEAGFVRFRRTRT